jgi:hypothetical protein
LRNFTLPKTPEGWNEFLLNRYGYGFYEYALCFAFYLRDPRFEFSCSVETGIPRVSDIKTHAYYEDLKDKIRKKKSEIKAILEVEDLSDDENSYKTWYLKAPTYLSKHLDEISKEIRRMQEELLDRPIWIRGRGRRVEIRNIIASIFAQVSLKNGQTEWVVIEGLFRSFWDFLEGAPYRKELGEVKEDIMYYKFQNEYKEIAKDSRKECEIQNWALIFFPVPRKKKFVNIKFKKDWITIDERYSRDPLITFPDGTSFREDITLRKATPPLKDFPVKKKRKKEKAFTIHFTEDDYRAVMKYKELTKDGNKF